MKLRGAPMIEPIKRPPEPPRLTVSGWSAKRRWPMWRRCKLKLTASEGYADVLLGEQTRRRAKALAEAMGLKLEI